MTRNEEYIQNAFNMFFKVMDRISNWKESELKGNIIELNTKHLLSNLDKALVQEFNEDTDEQHSTDNKEQSKKSE